MKYLCLVVLMAAAVFSAKPAEARNEKIKLSINDALTSSSAEAKVDKSIKLYFGTKHKLSVKKNFGEFTTNKKTNAFNKTDRAACEWAFLSAMITLQERAKKEGGDAVINIKSYYYKTELDSAEMFECGAGNVVAGVTFKGDVVKLK